MSNFKRETKHPVTGKWEDAEWLDDYFGKHRYGVRFPSEPGHTYNGDLAFETRDNTTPTSSAPRTYYYEDQEFGGKIELTVPTLEDEHECDVNCPHQIPTSEVEEPQITLKNSVWFDGCRVKNQAGDGHTFLPPCEKYDPNAMLFGCATPEVEEPCINGLRKAGAGTVPCFATPVHTTWEGEKEFKKSLNDRVSAGFRYENPELSKAACDWAVEEVGRLLAHAKEEGRVAFKQRLEKEILARIFYIGTDLPQTPNNTNELFVLIGTPAQFIASLSYLPPKEI